MQYIEMLDRIFRVQDNTRSIRDGHLVVDVGTQGVYNLRRAQSTSTYLLQRVGDLADTQTVYSIKTLDVGNHNDRDRIIPKTSHLEFNIFCDEVKKKSSPAYTNPFDDLDGDTVYNYAIMENKPVPPKPIKVVEATHKHIQMLRNDLDLPDGAVEILNKYAQYRKFRDEYEQPIKIADVDNIVELNIETCETFDAFITSLSEYVKINFLRNVTTPYIMNRFVTSSHEWKSSTHIEKTVDSSIATSSRKILFVQLLLVSSEGKRQYISFKISSGTRQDVFEIMNYACKIKPTEPKYRFAGLEKYIDECKTRVLGDKYNRELQYTTLTGVL